MKRIIFVFLVILIAVPVFSQAGLQPAATVNLIRTEAVTVGQLRTEVERMEKAGGRTLTHTERLQVLDVIVNERLVLQAAERDRVAITENEVNQQIQQLRGVLTQQLGRPPTDDEFAQAVMNESGLTVTVFRDQLRRQMIVEKYLRTKKANLFESIKEPTTDEILAEYNLQKSNFVRPETALIAMIQVPYGPDSASRTRARELANRLLQEINAQGFDQVAARSVRPDSGYQAGNLGYIPRNPEARNVLGQDFINSAFALRVGQVSRIIEGTQGFQIINIKEYYPQTNLELDDIIQPGTQVTVRAYIHNAMLNQKLQAARAQASQELVAELRTGRSFQIFENNIRW
ncbi:MAG: SurA N-terminal domain-containing protein [Treponema sp.]|nr:SurA N-terminal domain-containing protein [Treponema sp.]